MTVSVRGKPFTYSHTIGTLAQTGRGFSNPFDLALGENGLIYVLNRSNSQQGPQGAVRVTICTLDEEYVGQFSGFGEEDGLLTWPTSIATDSRGNVYIADEHRHDVQVFGPDHSFVRKWGGHGSGDGQLDRPSGLAVDADDNVWVVDHMNHRICKFTSEGQLITSWGSAGNGPGQFDLPWGICVDKQGNVYVADWRNDRVQKLAGDGTYLDTIGSPGSEVGQLRRPANVAVDDEGNVYVADWGNERVAIFTAHGYPITTLIGDSEMSKWGAEYLAANQDLMAGRKIMHDGTPEKRFHGPTAVEVDDQGHLIVVDSCRHRLQVYEKVGA
jgi:DNA-binding beta-propeller fold protein YncE